MKSFVEKNLDIKTVDATAGALIVARSGIIENLNAFVNAIMKVKPATVKGKYVKNISISSTMGPGIKLDLNSFDK